MTTRHEGVAKHADVQTEPYRPSLLNLENSYELFCRNAFPKSPPHSCPPALESLANKIVQICSGLPLALIELGCILSRKEPTVQAWKDVVSGLNWELTKGKSQIASVLALSFDDLNSDIKRCLLYCCAYPRDSEIRVRRLLRQWIAEGFVQKQGGKRLEAVAMDYLVELVERSLIQPCKRNLFGQIKSCRVHDVLLRTLEVIAEERNFFQIYSGRGNNFDMSKCRRLAIHHRLEQETPHLPLARSFISFEQSETSICYVPVQCFKLLKVLDLEGVRGVKELPKEIGDLTLLRYLGLRDTSIEKLPRSIKRLYNLQTLDLRTSAKGSSLLQSKIPLKYFKAKHVSRMTSLRHLYFGNRRMESFNALEVPDNFGTKGALKELQTLSYVKAGGWVEKVLYTMTSLVKLGMQVTKGYRSSTLGPIGELSQLDSLYLQGGLEDLPVNVFENLTKLTLDSSCLQDDPFSGLQTLKLLKSMKLTNNAYKGKILSCSRGGFSNLEVLNLENLDSLENMAVESGAFRQLKYMRISSCNKLVEIPQGLDKMGSIEKLNLIDMMPCLVKKVQDREGSDWHKIKHIQSIIITTSAVEREFDIALLN